MKERTTITGTTLGAKLTALCWGSLTLLAPVAVSACSGPSSSSSTPIFTPSVSTSSATPGSLASSPGGTTSPATPGVNTSTTTSSPSAQTHETTETARAVTPSPADTSPVPNAAPVTGGGGTAGLQDGLLFGLGGAAILAGAGSIAYRRRLTRNR